MAVREIAGELDVPTAWVISAFLPDAMETVFSKLTEDEVAFVRSEAARRPENPLSPGFTVTGHS